MHHNNDKNIDMLNFIQNIKKYKIIMLQVDDIIFIHLDHGTVNEWDLLIRGIIVHFVLWWIIQPMTISVVFNLFSISAINNTIIEFLSFRFVAQNVTNLN